MRRRRRRVPRSPRPASRSSTARSRRSTGTPTRPRRAATRPSCSRRSTSRPTRSPRRSPTAPSARDGVDLGDLGAIDDEFLRAPAPRRRRGLRHLLPRRPVGRYAIEQWARVPVEMDIASEYRYRDPVVGPDDLVDRHHAVGRDGRHAGGHAAGARARRARARDHQRDGLAGHARRRRRPVHARGARDRRRRDQDVRHARSPRCTCSRCGWPSCAARCRPSARASSSPSSSACPHCVAEMLANGLDRGGRARPPRAHHDGRVLPLPRPPRRAARRARGRAQAQGDLLHRRPTPTRPAR